MWFWAAQFGAFGFVTARAPRINPGEVFVTSSAVALFAWIMTLGIGSVIINSRAAKRASSFYLKRRHDEAAQTRRVWIACLATGLLIAAGAAARIYGLGGLRETVGFLEAGIWLGLACVPRFALRHAGKVALLALLSGVIAKTVAPLSFSPVALVYAALFVALYRVWSERRFARKHLLNHSSTEHQGQAPRASSRWVTSQPMRDAASLT